jgi:hypothetical protein
VPRNQACSIVRATDGERTDLIGRLPEEEEKRALFGPKLAEPLLRKQLFGHILPFCGQFPHGLYSLLEQFCHRISIAHFCALAQSVHLVRASSSASWRLQGMIDEPRAAARRRTCNSASCLRGDDGFCTGHRAALRPEGHLAASHDRLDLGDADDDRQLELVLDSSAAPVGTLEPDPSPVDLYPGHAAAGGPGRPSPRRSTITAAP